MLLNALGTMPDRSEGMFSFSPGLAVRRVVLRLLRRLPSPEAVQECVRKILPELSTLSAELQLLQLVGHAENAGHKLVSEETDDELMREWRDRVREAPTELLAGETDLLDVLVTASRGCGKDEASIEVPNSPDITVKLLEDARGEVRSQTMGSRTVRRAVRLYWDVLMEVAGGEEVLRERIGAVPPDHPGRDATLMALAARYLSGWRPSQFLEDDEGEGT